MEPLTPNSLRSGRVVADDRDRKFEVICKVRPLQEAEPSEDITIGEEAPTITIFNHPKNTSKEFIFHRVFGEHTPQAEFSSNIAAETIAVSRQNGKGCLVLSYGVTNSGKTYTIFGSPGHPGILPALITALATDVRIRAMQIYNDVIYCLRSGREVQWSERKGMEQCEAVEVNQGNAEEIIASLTRMRRTNETEANQNSSRSHAIFMVEWEGLHVAIADLAGNEKFNENTNFTETCKINGNLLVLGQCISAFRDGGYIPYRRSKLTQVLMEYFKPLYKIYMIAHLNRSGQMFHENLNVLQYAAISTQITHLHPNFAKNPSIAKSLRKPAPTPPPTLTPHSPAKRLDREEEVDRQQNRFLLERYKCYIMGVNAQAETDLDEYFRREDEKDRLFLEQLKASKFQSPTNDRQRWLQQMGAESRMKLREMFREEAMREQRHKQVDCATIMGQSILKEYYDQLQYQEQQRKRAEEEERRAMDEQRAMEELIRQEEREKQFQEERERAYWMEERMRAMEGEVEKKPITVDFSTSMGSSFKKEGLPSGLIEQGLRTPQKLPTGAETGSFFRRMVSNPASMIESGYRMITNLHDVANCMMTTFRGLVCEHRPMPNNPDGQRLAAHFANVVCNKKVEVVGEPDAERLVVVKQQQQSFWDTLPQQQQEVVQVQEIEFKDETAEAMPSQKRKPEGQKQQEHKEESVEQGERQDVRYEEPILEMAADSQNSIPFQSQESTIMARQYLSQSQSPGEETKQVNALILHNLRESQKDQSILPINAISIRISNHQQQPQESMLLDGIRSSKNLSTNRTSEVDLLRSDSTCKNQLLPVTETIPEAENETSTKVLPGRSPQSIRALPASLMPYLNKQSEPINNLRLEGKLNETGFKSTQQTFQTGSERSKLSRSISHQKKSNKHHHCNSKAKEKIVVHHSRKENYLRKRSKESQENSSRDNSCIKTRNQRKAKK